ncbi:hypothetical protein ACJDU8_06590 [Clostridium sp. WILCCON 0269]|uniref:HTH cro/C1-type domain-containing protein n=1 Tax=Candidatus Clostridium eludens TaxID=3381663 RepID=A0ABW8SJ63_9CLOT
MKSNINSEYYMEAENKYLKLRQILKKCREENRRTFEDISNSCRFNQEELENIEKGIDKDITHFLIYAKALGISINLSYKENYKLR